MITTTQRYILAELKASAPLFAEELAGIILEQQPGVRSYDQARALTEQALQGLIVADLVCPYDSTSAYDLTDRGYSLPPMHPTTTI